MVNLLVVCMGNICRSPMARAVLHAEVERRGWSQRVALDSAGTYAGRAGERPDPRAQLLAAQRGYASILHGLARHVQDGDFERFDLILAMDHNNLANLRKRCPPELQHKLHLFLDYAGLGESEVPDPYTGPPEAFEVVLDWCERAAPRVLERVNEELLNAR